MMVSTVFLVILQMSLSMSAAIVFVLLLGRIFGKLPRGIIYFLWCLVFLLLLVPVGSIRRWREDTALEAKGLTGPSYRVDEEGATCEFIMDQDGSWSWQKTDSGWEQLKTEVARNGISGLESYALQGDALVQLDRRFFHLCAAVYLLGVAVLFGAFCIRYISAKRKLAKRVLEKKGNYAIADVPVAFTFGILHPCCYLPAGMREEQQEIVLRHERVHIARRDTAVKAVMGVCLILHWFNPLVWIAYFRMLQEMEMSCDERVLRGFDGAFHLEYVKTLIELSVSTGKDIPGAVGYRAGGHKGRILHAIRYKKLTQSVGALLLLLGTAAAGLVLSLGCLAPVFAEAGTEQGSGFVTDVPLKKKEISMLLSNGEKSVAAKDTEWAFVDGEPEVWIMAEREVEPEELPDLVKKWEKQGLEKLEEQKVRDVPDYGTDAAYEEKTYTRVYSLYADGDPALTVVETCVVYYYENKIVHLYRRGLALYARAGYEASYLTCGRIRNYNEELCYISDKLTVVKGKAKRWYSLNCSVTPQETELYCGVTR